MAGKAQKAQQQTAAAKASPPQAENAGTGNAVADRFISTREISQAALSKYANAKDVQASWSQYLRPAAVQVLEAFETLLDDSGFWSSAEITEFELRGTEPETAASLLELTRLRLNDLLDFMGYKPPPPSVDLVDDFRAALSSVLSTPAEDDRRAQRTREALYQISVFKFRLRRLINDVDKLPIGAPQSAELRYRVTRAVRAGASAAIPGAIAAGVAVVGFPPAGIAAGAAAVGAGVEAATKELVKESTKLAAARVIARLLGSDDSDPVSEYFGALTAYADASITLRYYMTSAAEKVAAGEASSRFLIQVTLLEYTRWLIRVMDTLTQIDDYRTRLIAQELQARLDGASEIGEWIDIGADAELSDLAKRFETAEHYFEARLERHIKLVDSNP